MSGPNVMRGYLGRPDETSKALKGGWLDTGDVGYLDEDGYLFLVDRKKDLIIRGGENIYPTELEHDKLPKEVRLIEALPRNAVGKVAKRDLRERVKP